MSKPPKPKKKPPAREQPKKRPMAVGVKAALIGGVFVVLAALITGYATIRAAEIGAKKSTPGSCETACAADSQAAQLVEAPEVSYSLVRDLISAPERNRP